MDERDYEIQKLKDKIHELYNLKQEYIKELIWCRNELCMKCGLYHDAHLGRCKGCKYEYLDDLYSKIEEKAKAKE